MSLTIPNQLLPTKIARSEDDHITYTLKVLPGIPPEDVCDPDFWQHLCAPMGRRQRGKLSVDDKIEIIAQDGAFEVWLRVIAIDPRGMWAQTRLLLAVDADGVAIPMVRRSVGSEAMLDAPDSDGYHVEFAGPHKFRILRGSDVLEAHLPTKAAAYAKLAEIRAEKAAA